MYSPLPGFDTILSPTEPIAAVIVEDNLATDRVSLTNQNMNL